MKPSCSLEKGFVMSEKTRKNETLIYENKLRYTEIENLQIQDIDKFFALIRIQRGNRVFRAAISQRISEKMKLLMKYKDKKSYIFTKNLIEDKPISRTMITKIIKRHKKDDSSYENIIKPVQTVERVCDKYMIYKNNRVIEGLAINNITNALRICDILNAREYLIKWNPSYNLKIEIDSINIFIDAV